MNEKKKSRKSNGSGYTYRVGNSWKTVIEVGGRRITATNKSKQESRRLAKDKASKTGTLNRGSVTGAKKLTLDDLVFLLPKSQYFRLPGTASMRSLLPPHLGNSRLGLSFLLISLRTLRV